MIPVRTEAKYVRLHLNQCLTRRQHIKAKRSQINIKLRQIDLLLGLKSKLSLENKVLVYKRIHKPIWTYGIHLWGCAKKSTVNTIQRYRSDVFWDVVDTPWYVTNDLNIPLVGDMICFCLPHERLHVVTIKSCCTVSKNATQKKNEQT